MKEASKEGKKGLMIAQDDSLSSLLITCNTKLLDGYNDSLVVRRIKEKNLKKWRDYVVSE